MLRLIIKNSHLKMFYKFLTPILFNNLGNESNTPVLSYVSDLLSTQVPRVLIYHRRLLKTCFG